MSTNEKMIDSSITLERSDRDTIEHTLGIIEKHFGLI